MSFSKPSNYCPVTRYPHSQDLSFCTACGYAADTIDLTESPISNRTISKPTQQSTQVVRLRASQDHLNLANQRAIQRQEGQRDAGSSALSTVRPSNSVLSLQRYRINVSLFHRTYRFENKQARSIGMQEPLKHTIAGSYDS